MACYHSSFELQYDSKIRSNVSFSILKIGRMFLELLFLIILSTIRLHCFQKFITEFLSLRMNKP